MKGDCRLLYNVEANMSSGKTSVIRGLKGFFRIPRFRLPAASSILLVAGYWLLVTFCPLPITAASLTELGSEGDLIVLGLSGTATDPNTKIKGFTVFGATQAAYTNAVIGDGNVVINGYLNVSSGAWFVGSSTFSSTVNLPAPTSLYISGGSSNQVITKNTTTGAMQWADVSAMGLGDSLGSHTATQTLNMDTFGIIGAGAVTASSFTANGPLGLSAAQVRLANNVIVSSTTADYYGGVYASTHVYLNGDLHALNLYGNGAGLTGVSAKTYSSVVLSLTLNEAAEIGYFTLSGKGHNLYIAVTVSDTNFYVSKQYALPLRYNMSGATWYDVLPISNTGATNGNDFALEVKVTNSIAYLRLRRVNGAAAGTAVVSMEQLGHSDDVFTETSNYVASSARNFLPSTVFTQTGGYVGIGTSLPGSMLDVAGDVLLSGASRVLNLGTSQGIKDTGISDLTLFTSAGPVILSPGDVEAARVTMDRKVGIGPDTPSARLHVSSAAGTTGDMVVISTGGTNVIRMTGGGEIFATKFIGDGSALTGTGSTYTADEVSLHLSGSVFSALDSSVTLQGNTFNAANKLVKLNGSTQLPALDASLLLKVSSIAVGAVYTGAILDNAVTGAKIALGSDAQGDVMYYNGTDWARLGAGTSGMFLKTQGAGANPVWATDNNTAYTADEVSLHLSGSVFSALDSSVTLQGNTFNAANKLVKLNGSTQLPALDASLLLKVSSIAVGAVYTGAILDNAVTGAKIALGSDAQGDVMYYNGTDWARLGAGTSGMFLKTQGAGANPVWATASGSDNLGSHVATQTLDMDGFAIFDVSTITMSNGSISIVPPGTSGSDASYGISIGSGAYNNYNAGVGVGNGASGNYDDGVGVGFWAQDNYNNGVGVGNGASGNYSYAVGVGAAAYNNYSYGVGVGNGAFSNYGYGVGVGNSAFNNYTNGVGVGSTASGNYSYGVGVGNAAFGNHDYAVGVGAYSQNNAAYGTGVGAYTQAYSSSAAFGYEAKAQNNEALALGAGAKANAFQSVCIGAYCVNNATTTVKIREGYTLYVDSMNVNSTVHLPAPTSLYISGGASNQVIAKNTATGAMQWADVSALVSAYTADEVSLHLSGTVFSALDSSVTLQGNTFNAANKLVKLNGSTQLPAVDASLLLKVSSIAVGAVYTGAILDNAVTGAKIALGSDAQGDVMYYNGTDWARLGAGTSGMFLKTQGAGANPLWATASGSDNLGSHIATQTLNMGAFQIAGTGALTMSSATFTNTAGAGLSVSSSAYLAVSGGNVGIGTASPSARLHLALDAASTNTQLELARLQRTTSGTAATGIGSYTSSYLEDAGGGLFEAGRVGFQATNVTAGAASAAAFMGYAEREVYTEMFPVFAARATDADRFLCMNGIEGAVSGWDCFGMTIGSADAVSFNFNGTGRWSFDYAGDSADTLTMRTVHTNDGLKIKTVGSKPIYFDTSNNGTDLYIASDGNVGIGATPDAGTKLELGGTSTMQFDTSNSGYVSLKVNDVEVARMRNN